MIVCGLRAHLINVLTWVGGVQITNAVAIAAANSYRDLTPDRPFTSPTFHAVLRGCFKGRAGVYTVHDAAFANLICDAFLRGVNMQKKSALGGFDKKYNEFLAVAREVQGQDLQSDPAAPQVKFVRGNTAAATTGFVLHMCLCCCCLLIDWNGLPFVQLVQSGHQLT